MGRIHEIGSAIRRIHARGEYPSAARINKEIGSNRKDLNSRELSVRNEVFEELNIKVK